jgi:aryl-alcohol dehydrogenase
MKAKAAVLHETGKALQIEFVDIAEPKENEVLVKIVATGICHSDEAGRMGYAKIPAILGHEGSGIVEQVGGNVTSIKKGDHVVLALATCGECRYCAAEQPFSCIEQRKLNFGGTMRDGTYRITQDGEGINNYFGQSSFATYAVVDIHSVIKVDKDVDLSILGPLGCGFETGAGTVLGYLNAKPGTSIAVFGCGSVGFAAILAAKIAGCKNIIAVGGTPDKLKLALEMGATHIINRKETPDIVSEIRQITGDGVEYSIDTTAQPDIIMTGIKSMAAMGTMVLLGLGPDITFNPSLIMGRSQAVAATSIGCVNPQDFIPKMISYYKEGRFPFDKLITFYELEDIEKAFHDSEKGLVVKPVIKMPL